MYSLPAGYTLAKYNAEIKYWGSKAVLADLRGKDSSQYRAKVRALQQAARIAREAAQRV